MPLVAAMAVLVVVEVAPGSVVVWVALIVVMSRRERLRAGSDRNTQ